MCDDFMDDWDGLDDTFSDPADDCEEDIADMFDGICDDNFFDNEQDNPSMEEGQEQLNIADAFIFGTMIYGCAYEEKAEEKKRKQEIVQNKGRKQK